MAEAVFQPFTDRLSRDIRNDLSKSLVTVIYDQSLDPARKIAGNYLQANPAPVYRDYINDRLSRYQRVLEIIGDRTNDPLFIALVLWDEQLFFEVHEILEHAWLKTKGEEKLFLQAMIRSAGVYVKRDAGYADVAARLCLKALPVLENNRHRLAPYTDPERLIQALRHGNAPPPLLLTKRIQK
jgi:uncharacterized protein